MKASIYDAIYSYRKKRGDHPQDYNESSYDPYGFEYPSSRSRIYQISKPIGKEMASYLNREDIEGVDADSPVRKELKIAFNI